MASAALVNDLAVRAAARHPVWTAITPSIYPPNSLSAGAVITGALFTLVRCQLRAAPRHQQAVLTLSAFGAGDNLTLTVDGDDAVASGATEADLLDAMKVAIDALGKDLSCSVSYVTRSVTCLVNTNTTYTFEKSDAGSNVSALVADLAEANFRLWVLPAGAESIAEWSQAADAEFTISNNWVERFRTAGFARLAVEVLGSDGATLPAFAVGPADATDSQ